MPEIKTQISPQLYYRKMGTGPAVVLLHGFPESNHIWSAVWDDLCEQFTLIIPDFPGSGESELEKETSIYDMADCIAEILDNEKIEKAVIAGHSMGGYVGLAFAEKYPGKVIGLSLVHSTTEADDEEKKNTRLKAIELIRKGGKNAFIRQIIANLFSPHFKQAHPEIVEQQTEEALEMEEKSLINYYFAMIGRKDQSFWLKNTSIPVQWIIGMEDNLIYYKKILEQSAKSGINFVTFYNNCGHMSMLEDPNKLINDLKEFINYSYESV